MSTRKDIVLASDSDELSIALGCTPAVIEDLHDRGVLARHGELWEVGPARDYLRDAAWADNLWH